MNPSDTESAFAEASGFALDYLRTLQVRPVAPAEAVRQQLKGFDVAFPEQASAPGEVLHELHALGSPATMASAGGRFFGLVVGGTLPASLGARVLTSAWDQIVFNDAVSPAGCAIERVAARWVLEALSLPAESHVHFVTGATMGNFTCLAAARQALLARAGHDPLEHGLWNAPRIRVVASQESHVTVTKALNLLGWGRVDVERVAVDRQGRLVVSELPQLDAKTIVCLQAGNVNSGSFDPFDEVCARAREVGAWVHVDGAFGLWAAASDRQQHLTQGLANADSWVTDGHKWLNTPYDCGMAIVRNAEPLHHVMATQAPYLKAGVGLAPKDMGPEFSRSARAVEVWAALRSLGRVGLQELLQRTCEHATQLAEGLQAMGWTIRNDVVLNQVVASIGTPEQHAQIAELCQASGECWFGTTVWQAQSAIRLAVSNWSTTSEDIARTLRCIETATRKVVRQP